MKIAVAAEDGYVSFHFGHCPEYRIFDVENSNIDFSDTLANPGHQPGVLPRFLADHGINCIIAGGMGPRAIELFKESNIEVVVGAMGKVEDVVEAYVKGTLVTSHTACTHDDENKGGHCQDHKS
jgi:predicted Fe-Mo cluster-binding NifX family protein